MVLVLLTASSPVLANEAETMARAQLRLSTEPATATGCLGMGQVTDDSVKDLRRKIVRVGGDTAIVWFGADEIHAQVFRCAGLPVAPAPAKGLIIPPPPPGSPPPPPPGVAR